jgi:hypothetical protein
MTTNIKSGILNVIRYVFDFTVVMVKIAGVLAAAYLAQVLFAFLMGWL